MRALQVSASLPEPALQMVDVPVPVPRNDEILIKVCAAGVTPSELVWYPTSHHPDGTPRTHAIPGHEFSGVVAALGHGVEQFRLGDLVFGMNDWFIKGATAEYCLTTARSIAHKPARLTHAVAATVPIAALTAWQGLYERANLQPGERVLVHGAAGAVGIFCVQLARLRKAEVIATASARNLDFVSSLGANQVIDYTAGPFEQSVRDVDVVFDTVGGDTLGRSWDVLKPGGRLVTIAADSEGTHDEKVKQALFIVESNQQQLVEVAALLDAGRFRAFVDAEVALSDAASAYARKTRRDRGYGKTVIVIPFTKIKPM